ncbi:MAG: DNA repair protein RadC [Bacilli bacterium]|nr:DNA repair protein RadC [Bacilli bacterium]
MENVKIKKIPINDRPRERLINYGSNSLSNEELLSILLNSGTKNISVKNLASIILSRTNNLKDLEKLSYHDLISIKGVGSAKASIILSFLELSKRIKMEDNKIINIKLNEPSKVFNYFKYRVNKYQEEFYCIYLDAKKKVINSKLLFIGTVNHSMVHPRDIFKEAYSLNAAFIICVHNHPSGDVNPSLDDINVTKRIFEIGNLMGIKLVDHIIVSEKKYYSFLENGKI